MDLPREVLLPVDYADAEVMEGILTERSGHRVRILRPQRGGKKRLLDLAGTNARNALEDQVPESEDAAHRADDALFSLQEHLDLKVIPRNIVCFDISHIQGTDTVGSAVLFENGAPKKAGYRHMRIKGEWGNDDYRSMEEVVTRYFRRAVDEESVLPDLAVIDGGKGQLSAARSALDGLKLQTVVAVALAKKEEEVFMVGRRDPVILPRRDGALYLLQRLRDEAHRFAITYNRKLRSKRTLTSRLEEIPGVGPNRQKALLHHFGSVRAIGQAPPEEIARLPGFGQALAMRILTYLKV